METEEEEREGKREGGKERERWWGKKECSENLEDKY